MKCTSCAHVNLSDFPFCEQCLELLPTAGSGRAGGFDLLDDGPNPMAIRSGVWPPFPWNPKELQNPLVGREKAVHDLLDAFKDVNTHLHARIHLLLSAYGMGKSRVVDAMVAKARGIDEDTLVVKTRCASGGRPFRMWDGIIRGIFEIPADADPESAGARLMNGLKEDAADEARELAGLIGGLLGYHVPGVGPSADDDEAVVGRGTAALMRVLGLVSARRNVVIVVENANAASRSSLALASSIEASLRDRPVLLLLLGSPELESILPKRDRVSVTSLAKLSKREADQILRLFLAGIDDIPKEVGQRILSNAHGNPYAIKSMVRYLREAGAIRLDRKRWKISEEIAWDLELPSDLAGVVLAQYGLLTAEERVMLGQAAIVGERFWLGVLVALARVEATGGDELGSTPRDKVPQRIRTTIQRFCELGFFERRESRVEGVEAFAFRTHTHHQVALSLLPVTAHQKVHEVTWQWLVMQLGDRADEMLDRLAEHAQGAGEHAHAARYLLRAAEGAGARVEPDEERRLFTAAEALVGDGDVATRLQIAQGLGDALARAGDVEGALDRYDQALKLSWRMRMRSSGALALERIGKVERDRGNLKGSEDYMLQAMRLFESVEDQEGVAGVCHDLGTVYWLRGELEGALQLYRKAELIYRELQDERGLSAILHGVGVIHLDRGQLDAAAEVLDQAQQLRRALGDPASIAATLNALGVLAASQQRSEDAVRDWTEALEHAERSADMGWVATVSNNLSEALMPMGRLDEARRCLERAIDSAEMAERPRVEIDARRNLALLIGLQGDYEASQDSIETARTLAKRLGQPRVTAAVERSAGELACGQARQLEDAGGKAKPHWSRAEASFRKAAQTFEKAGYLLEAATTVGLLADTLYELGKIEEAEDQRRRQASLEASRLKEGDAAS